MLTSTDLRETLATTGKLLLFRPVKPDLPRHTPLYLLIGIGSAWLAGVGRYWDHPDAAWWQYAGIGSVVYIFALALVLYLLLLPLRPHDWTYGRVLTFVGLTAPPGILYAIPVERFLSLDAAQSVNFWFLAVVASWRVALLWRFLRGSARLPGAVAGVALLLPLCLIVATLTVLNLEKAVFQIMAGLHGKNATPNDGAYLVLVLLTGISFYASPFLLFAYGLQINNRRNDKNIKVSSEAESVEPVKDETT
ncbi:MAG: hypothetical protein H7145_11530 [Akkermansiaceae bacterium]|nr:hypothetical protein [Armatimonadota bacterium]